MGLGKLNRKGTGGRRGVVGRGLIGIGLVGSLSVSRLNREKAGERGEDGLLWSSWRSKTSELLLRSIARGGAFGRRGTSDVVDALEDDIVGGVVDLGVSGVRRSL